MRLLASEIQEGDELLLKKLTSKTVEYTYTPPVSHIKYTDNKITVYFIRNEGFRIFKIDEVVNVVRKKK